MHKHFDFQQVENFYAQYPDAGTGAQYRANSLDSIRNNIKWRSRSEQEIIDWLNDSGKWKRWFQIYICLYMSLYMDLFFLAYVIFCFRQYISNSKTMMCFQNTLWFCLNAWYSCVMISWSSSIINVDNLMFRAPDFAD